MSAGALNALLADSRRWTAVPDDYDGAVRRDPRAPCLRGESRRGAALYLHGYADYFFQRHMAERFAAEGFAFFRARPCANMPFAAAAPAPEFLQARREYLRRHHGGHRRDRRAGAARRPFDRGLVGSLYGTEGARAGDVKALWLQ